MDLETLSFRTRNMPALTVGTMTMTAGSITPMIQVVKQQRMMMSLTLHPLLQMMTSRQR